MSDLSRVDFLVINVYGVDNEVGGSRLMIDTSLYPKENLSDDYSDLYDILLRIHKFSKTELELYSKEKIARGY